MSDAINKYATIEYDEANRWVYFTYQGALPSEIYRFAIEEVIALTAAKRCPKMLVNSTRMSTVSQEDQKWMVNYWRTEGVRAGLRATAVIVPEIVAQMMATTKRKKYQSETEYFGSEAKAAVWLSSLSY